MTTSTAYAIDLPDVPPNPFEVEHLREWAGDIVDGYDERKVNSLAAPFTTIRLVCVWDRYDADGTGGNSEFIGRALDPGSRDEVGPWRVLHPDVYAYLMGEPAPGDNTSGAATVEGGSPAGFVSLLGATWGTGEAPAVEWEDGFGNVALLDDYEQCAHDGCSGSLDDGEGYDGYCGGCADLISVHDDGEHDDAPDTDCPTCS